MTQELKIDIFKTSGFYSFLGVDKNKPAPIPDKEIDVIKEIIHSGLPIQSLNGMIKGDTVKVLEGPLQGTLGKYISENEKKGKFYVNIDFLNRSIEVELDYQMFEKV